MGLAPFLPQGKLVIKTLNRRRLRSALDPVAFQRRLSKTYFWFGAIVPNLVILSRRLESNRLSCAIKFPPKLHAFDSSRVHFAAAPWPAITLKSVLDLESRSAKNVSDATSVHGAVAVKGPLESNMSSIKVAMVGPVEPTQLEGPLSQVARAGLAQVVSCGSCKATGYQLKGVSPNPVLRHLPQGAF